MDAKELFMAMVLFSTGSNIKEGKIGFDDAGRFISADRFGLKSGSQ